MIRARIGLWILAASASAAAASLMGLRAASAAALDHEEGAFAVCFAPPRVAAPSPDVYARVAAFDSELDRRLAPSDPPEFRAFAHAIITHESGGDPLAISPTGCAGAVGISAPPPGHEACCEIDEADGYRHGYDRCNSESRAGYRCRPDDPRFTPAFAAEFAIDRFRRIRGLIAAEARGAAPADARVVVPLAWNAGVGVFPPFPLAMRSPESALERLDFSGKAPYTAFRLRGHVNKVVEIYDYLAWFRFLADYWQGGTPATPPAAELVCVDYVGGANRSATIQRGLRAMLIRRIAVATAIRRLAFGQYDPATAYVAAGALRPLVWWLADAFE